MDASRIVVEMSLDSVEVMGLRGVVLTPKVIAGGTVEVTLKRVLSLGDLVVMDQTKDNSNRPGLNCIKGRNHHLVYPRESFLPGLEGVRPRHFLREF